jgi:hypothetical protein
MGKVIECIKEWEPWASEEAKKLLESKSETAHPNVVAHWKRLAGESL